MKLIDRYILRKYLTTFVFVVMVMLIILVVIDSVEKNDDFIRNKPGLKVIVFDYYLNFLPYWGSLLAPITVFIATVLVTARLAARTEIIAVLSSGASFLRLLYPYLVGSCIIGGALFFLGGWVVPISNRERVAFELKYVKRPYYYDKRNVHIKVGPETFVYLESYNNQTNTGFQVTIESIANTKLYSKLKGDRLLWLPEEKRWRIENVRLRKIDEEGKETIAFLPTVDTTLNLLPKDFESTYMLYETLTMPQLEAYIDDQLQRGTGDVEPFLVEKYMRYTSPFAIIILTMIGVILSSRKSRQGTGVQIALGFVLAFVYILFFMLSRSVANTGNIDPLLATWLPNIVFACIGVLLYKTVPK